MWTKKRAKRKQKKTKKIKRKTKRKIRIRRVKTNNILIMTTMMIVRKTIRMKSN